MKKILMAALALLCVFSLMLGAVGCSTINNDGTANTETAAPTADPTESSAITEPQADTSLEAKKAAAKTEIDAYAKAEDYRDAQKTELATAIANGKATIDAAADTAAVNAALASAKTVIDGIKTDAELTAEEELAAAETLAAAKTAAKTQLDAYADADDYRQAQKTELAIAIANAKATIDAAADTAAVNAALASAKTVIDGIKTDAELTAEEELAAAETLAAAKTAAKTQLDAYADADDYRQAQKTELAIAIANGKAAIDAAADTAAVNAALASAKTTIDAIETDAQIIAKSPKITTTITNGMTFTNSKATLDVWVKNSTGSKLNADNVTVTVNGTTATVNWDDQEKTSYNFVFEAGQNTIVITAVDGAYTTTVTYVVNCNLAAPTTITVAVEGFTIGLDYIVAPYKLVLDENTLTEMANIYGYTDAAEMKENLTAAYALGYTLHIHGLTMDYQGGLASGNSFYMSSVSGLDTSNIAIPDELQSELENNGYAPEPYVYEEGTLGEFDITWGSGWMYFVNNVAPNVGFCDYIPQDGDVMRIQFTLAYGADIGSTMVGALWFESVDRDELTQLIADAIEAGVDYSEALEVVSTFGVTQDELDAACEALRAQLG